MSQNCQIEPQSVLSMKNTLTVNDFRFFFKWLAIESKI